MHSTKWSAKFKLNRINEIKDYFVAEIKESELMTIFDYFDKSLIYLNVTTGSISIASFATVIEAPVARMSASFSLAFSISTGIIKKLLKAMRNKKKKQWNC